MCKPMKVVHGTPPATFPQYKMRFASIALVLSSTISAQDPFDQYNCKRVLLTHVNDARRLRMLQSGAPPWSVLREMDPNPPDPEDMQIIIRDLNGLAGNHHITCQSEGVIHRLNMRVAKCCLDNPFADPDGSYDIESDSVSGQTIPGMPESVGDDTQAVYDDQPTYNSFPTTTSPPNLNLLNQVIKIFNVLHPEYDIYPDTLIRHPF